MTYVSHMPSAAAGSKAPFSTLERVFAYVAVFLAPYATFRFSDLFFTYSDFFFCLSFFLLLIGGQIQRRPLYQATQIWLVAFVLVFLGLLISSLAHDMPDRGFIVIIQYFFSYIILLMVLIRSGEGEAIRLAGVFMASMLLVDLHGIYTFYTTGFVPTGAKGVVSGSRRLATVLRDPNLAACQNALMMPILLYFWSSSRLKAYVAIPLIGVSFFTVILTSSNSGLMAMLVSMTVFATFALTTRAAIRLAIVLAAVVTILAALGGTDLLPATFQKRVLGALSSGDISEAGTFTARVELIKEAVQLISDNTIVFLGKGVDQFREISVQRAPVHNLYLLLWAEGGVLAIVGWVLFSVTGLMLAYSIKRAGGDRSAVAAVASVAVVFLSVAMFYPHLYARYWTLPVFLCLGIGMAELRRLDAVKDLADHIPSRRSPARTHA